MQRPLSALVLVLMACVADAQTPPDQIAISFWKWHALRVPSGALTTEELVEVRSLVTSDFMCLLEIATQFRDHFATVTPDEKPPFAEGDLFTSSAFERPSRFEIAKVQTYATKATAFTKFDAPDNISWRDSLSLRLENGEWRVADVVRGGQFEFGNAGSLVRQLYSAMSEDLPAGSWSGASARRCVEQPNKSVERTRER
jgi:hypothetical protein